MVRKLAWFIGIYLVSVISITVVAGLLKLWVG